MGSRGKARSGRRSRSGERRKDGRSILRVNAPKGVVRERAWKVLAGLTGVAVAAFLILFVARLAGGYLFSRNKMFTITSLQISGGDTITGDLVREYTQIHEGVNLFDVNIRAVRRDFLARVPNVRSMEIERELPGTLRIEIAERVPLARVGRQGSVVVDNSGHIFNLRSVTRELPVILGYIGGRSMPGEQLEGMGLAAVQVLDACDNPLLKLDVTAVEADKDDRLVVWLSDGRAADLSWPAMGKVSVASQRKLMEKLLGWSGTLQSPEGQNLSRFDYTFEGRIYAE